MAWRKHSEVFPAPLREFREAEWPPVEGGCLGHYSCRAEGYGAACAPWPGEVCGDRCYALLAAGYPDRPEVAAAARRADAFERYHQARMNWLGADHPYWLDEMTGGWQAADEIRYRPFRGPGS